MTRKLAYTCDEVAELLGCSSWLVRRAIASGQLPKVDPAMAGRRILVPAAALERRIDALAITNEVSQ